MRDVFTTPEANASAEQSRLVAIKSMGAELALAAHTDLVDLGDERAVSLFLAGRWAPSAINAYQEDATEIARAKVAEIRAAAIGLASVAIALGLAAVFPICCGGAS